MTTNLWEYEEFEFDNRVTNLMWTICGDYNQEMTGSEKSNLSKNIALYFGIIAGGRRKHILWSLVDSYVNWRSSQNFDQKTLQWLLQLGINGMVINQLIRNRPGIQDIQKNACCEMISLLGAPISSSFSDQIDYYLYSYLGGCLLSQENQYLSFIKRIITICQSGDTLDLIRGIDALYIWYYHPNHIQDFSLENIQNSIKKNSINTKTFIENAANKILSHDKFKNTDLAQQEVGAIEKAGIVYIDEEQLTLIKNNVTLFCGESYLNDYEVRRIENRLCKGPHRDCRLHFTNGVIRGNSPSLSKNKFVKKDYEKNQKAYEKNILVYERTIKRLRDILIQTLQAERAKYYVPSDFGTIDPHRLWRINKVPCSRLFKRTESNDKGDFVVDLLIDSSFSQNGRESRVAIQAYIIARALVEAGIPCRVNGFNSFMDFTVLKRYRDFDDPTKTTNNIFEYYCESSNRDGLAIKSVCDKLYCRNENNKILIVLSDGKPNDVHIVKENKKHKFRGQIVYSGGAAIGDTAKEIRIARQRNVLVLGIFTGNENDLKAEKLIYGNDFIFTRNVNHFAEIVAVYLKRIIRR